MNPKESGAKIKRLRESLGMTQTQLAEQVGVSVSSICKYEAGEKVPRDKTKIRLAEVLGRTTNYIFFK